MHALKLKVNFRTGERAGGIDPKSRDMPAYPSWQNVQAGTEIRLVLKGDVEKFRGVEGVEIIEGEAAIDAAVAGLKKRVAGYAITSEALLAYSLQRKQINLDGLGSDMAHETLLQKLFELGALGITHIPPTVPAKCCECVSMAKRREMEEGQGSREQGIEGSREGAAPGR